MEPASSIIRKLGGPNVVASIAGVHRTRVSNWMRDKEAGGTGGTIPMRHMRTLLDAAQARGVPLSADEFVPSAAQPERAA